MKKADLLIIISVLFVAAVLLLISFGTLSGKGKYAEVLLDGEAVLTFDLSEPVEYELKTESGTNLIVISDGFVSVKSADCPDQICVKHKKISKTGETIVCLPHKLVIRIIGAKEDEFDAYVS